MEYQVIARKWRPQTFNDVVGQEHITRTLTNAIIQGRTAHAYLFVGPRGIGKTTSARIFAKALNCLSPINGEPCCECVSCKSIASGNCMDIIEIDAASNNSVASMRELCDEVMYAPVNSTYKIYIIDEVHMLTAASWNALLKTVEEPPAHVKFIFATTEVHKVLPTILSRCQRFDLRRIPSSLICERLRFICDTEKVPISDGALIAIARAADGGMRDAQSLLDQMISFFSATGDTQISEEQVLSLFGLTAFMELEALLQAILENDRASMITNIFQLANRGKDLEKLLEEVMTFLRGIQICQILPDPTTVIDTGAESVALYQRLGQLTNPDVVQRLLEVLSPVGYTLRTALNKQVYLETIILKAMRVAHSAQVDDVIARLNQIRKNGELEVLDRVPPVQSENKKPRQEIVNPTHSVTASSVQSNDLTKPELTVETSSVPLEQDQVNEQNQTEVIEDTKIAVSDPAQSNVNMNQTSDGQIPPEDDEQPPWKVESGVEGTQSEQVVVETPELIRDFSKSEEVGILPLVEEVEQQLEVLEEIEHQHEAPAVIDLASTIPSVDTIESRDPRNDNVSPLDETLQNDISTSCCVEDNVVVATESSNDIVTAEGTLSPYPGDIVYQERCAVANEDMASEPEVSEMAYIDFDKIVESIDEVGHFDEAEHMDKLKRTARSNPMVSSIIDMFSGEIVDIHPGTKPEGV